MLEIKNIKKVYHMKNHEVQALNDVSLQVKPGNLVAIVGPSGCGKTSLMNIIGALDSDFSGEVIINGKNLKQAQTKDIDTYRKNSIGFIFQHFTLINSLNTFENVALAFDVSNVSRKERNEHTSQLLESVGLAEHAKKKVNVLSGGQKQRVAIARALANNPDIILADEPTGALDHKTGIQVMELLKEIAKDRIVVMVTHSPELAKEYANVIVSMEDGQISNVENNIISEKEIEVSENQNVSRSNMKLKTSFKLAYRNLLLKKGRTILTAIGMSIGIIGIALALALTNGTRHAVENQVKAIFPAGLIMVSDKDNQREVGSEIKKLDYDDYQNIKKLASDANSVIFFPDEIIGTIASFDKKTADVTKLQEKMANGEELEPHAFIFNSNLSSAYTGELGYGRLPQKSEPYEAILSLSTAKELLKKGQKIDDILNKTLYYSFLRDDNGNGNSEGQSKIVPIKIVGVTTENTLLDTIYLSDGFAKPLLKDYFNINYEDVESSSVIVTNNDVKDVKAYTKQLTDSQDKYLFEGMAQSILDTVNIILDAVRNGLVAFSSVSVFVAILMIAIVVYISVLERKQEIGIIRAIGGKTKDIRNMFLFESLAIGLLAGIIGISVSYGICLGINQVINSFLNSQGMNIPPMNVASLDPRDALILIAVCGILSVISGLIPALKAAKLDPIDAIRKK